jgi:hypothetical protein
MKMIIDTIFPRSPKINLYIINTPFPFLTNIYGYFSLKLHKNVPEINQGKGNVNN